MSDPYPILHDKDLTAEARIAQAFDWLARPEGCPAREQGPIAAKVYLIYRAIDGLLTPEQESQALAAKPVVISDMHRRVRWELSLKTALAYLDVARRDWQSACAKANTVRQSWEGYGMKWWPPQVINYLRMSCVVAYYQHLNGDHELAGKTVNNSMAHWQHFAGNLEWQSWPYIWVEDMLGQSMALRLLVFIGRAAGIVPFKDFGRDYCGSLDGDPKRCHDHVFYGLLRSIGTMNPDRAIWTL